MIRILHDLLYMIPLCLVFVSSGMTVFDIPGGVVTYPIALAVLGICMTIRYWKNKIRFILPGLALIPGICILLLRDVSEWGGTLLAGWWIYLITGLAVLSFFTGWLWISIRMAGRILTALIPVGLILIMVFDVSLPKIAVNLAEFLLVLQIVDEMEYHWKKSGSSDRFGHLVSIAPFLLLLGLGVVIAPAPEEPYDWAFAVGLWEKAEDTFRWIGNLFHGESEDYSRVIGFSDGESYWGDISGSNNTVMTLYGKENLGPTVYLRGKVMDTFDGRNWIDTYTETNHDDAIDSLETLYAVNRYGPDHIPDYLRRVDLKLRYEDFNTRYVFTPLKSMLRQNRADGEKYVRQGGDLVAEETLGYGTEYVVPYYRMNQDHKKFQDFVENAGIPDESGWEATRMRYSESDPRDTSYHSYQSYLDRIRKYYLPETELSPQAQEYMRRLIPETGGSDGQLTDYDKLLRIEEALGSLTYTDTPGALSEDITTPNAFLDDFLLKKQEGYCVYFATAFVLLARSEGIPARYVQGFHVPVGEKGSTEVSSGMSHAWPEAYLNGVGWIAFEPTPGEKEPSAWGVFDQKKNSWSTENENHIRDEKLLPTPAPTQASKEYEEGEGIRVSHILIYIALLVLLLIVFFLTERLVVKARYRKLDVEEKFRTVCGMNLKILEKLGFAFRQGETLEEFHARAGDEFGEESLGFLTECEYAAYAGKAIDTNMLSVALKSRAALMEHLKEIKGNLFFALTRIFKYDRI